AVPQPGLQVERTSLAWLRTALATGVTSGLFFHAQGFNTWVLPPAILGILLTLTLLALNQRRYKRVTLLIQAKRSPMNPTVIKTISLAVTILAISAFVTLAT